MNFATFQAPDPADYDNVRMLNRAWLRITRQNVAGDPGTLARSPFLLFSLRENDPEWWHEAIARQADLLQDAISADGPTRRLQAATIGFLWHLAERNPYAARLVSGASLAWCELLTSQALLTVIERVAERADLLSARFATDALCEPASQLTALQCMLTSPDSGSYRELPAAACHMPNARLQVADRFGGDEV